jgi:excinuclease ABC subunit B
VLDNVSQPDWVNAANDALAEAPEATAKGAPADEDDRTKLIARLEKEMKQAAERLEFERAAALRDRIYQIQTAE